MEKIKKLKGGHLVYVSEDEKLLINSNRSNSVCVHDLETREVLFTARTVSNVSSYAVSPDKKLIAAKNTRGELALISMDTHEEISRNKMQKCEGYQMAFTKDSKYVLDFDWAGNTMLLDCDTNECKVLSYLERSPYRMAPKCDCLGYDRYTDQIYLHAGDAGKSCIMTSPVSTDRMDFKVIKDSGFIPGDLSSLSLCKEKNYCLDPLREHMLIFDKVYRELEKRELPRMITDHMGKHLHMWVSPCERYVFFSNRHNFSCLYEMEGMNLIHKFDYESVSDFTMINNDTTFIIATWKDSYIGDITDL